MPVTLEKPRTHEGTAPADLVGSLVLVRPFYHTPGSRSSLKSTRSPFTYEARVIRTFATEMVTVQFTWDTDSAPWRREAVFHPYELHRTYGVCKCPACAGDGIHKHNGA